MMSFRSLLYRSDFRSRIGEFTFFIGTVFFLELLIQILSGWTLTFSRFWILLFFSVSYGAILCTASQLTASWKGKQTLMACLLALLGILFATEYFLYISYQTYMTFDSILTGGGNVATEFKGIVFELIFRRFWVILLFLLPVLFYVLFGRSKYPFEKQTIFHAAVCLVLSLVFFGFGSLSVSLSADKLRYREEYTFDAACHTFGLLTGCRLEIAHSTGGNQSLGFQLAEQTENTEAADELEAESGSSTPTVTTSAAKPTPHKMDIDFAALAEEESNSDIAELHTYVASLTPQKTNEYTGLFKGKNLIFITAEAFSKEVIDPELTPTLYRLANKGIVFEDYYQPAWGGSTSTGEYSNIIGLVPTNGVKSIQDTIGHNMYFTLGNQLQRENYFSAAYHNGLYDYYDRDKTHCNLGYSTMIGMGNGMEEGVTEVWPESDLEMIDFTVPQYIDKQPFSIYYMSVSGHCNYSQAGNAMSRKNYEATANLTCSETIKCYLAANLDLEYAMASLVKQLEDAGIADDTVIVIGADHYPYGLEKSDTWGNDKNYLAELFGYDPILNPEQDHNALIIWSGCLEDQEPIVVDTPTYSLDIVPTLSNLFGLEYDSRLLVGRDVFSKQEPLVIWGDYSWVSDKGYYSTSYGTFTPNEGVTVTDDYVKRIKSIVANRITFSRGVLQNDYYGILFGEDDVT